MAVVAHETVASLADEVLRDIADSRTALIYAPNSVGKTRLAQHLKDRDPEGVILYNSFIEDEFTWDNEQFVLKVDLGSGLFESVIEQGLDGAIVDSFRAYTSGRIEPRLDLINGEVSFGVQTGGDDSLDNIKISRAEESIFIWSVYQAVLNEAIETLADHPELRSTTDYDQLSIAVIDDPVSSMDDVRIVSVALALVELVERAAALDFKFVISTHHALFFNILFNSLGRKRSRTRPYVLARNPSSGWTLAKQSNDSPFSYHLQIIEGIQRAIAEDEIERVHFNQFRALLEKTANFLGRTGGWSGLLVGPNAALLARVLNLYSHDRFAEIETSKVADEYKEAFRDEFYEFLKAFGWAVAS